MYVFGVDIPLVEIFFVLTIVTILILFFLIFIMVEVIRTNLKLTKMVADEKKSIKELDAIQEELTTTKEETEKDMILLEDIRKELGEILKDERQELRFLKGLKEVEGRVKKRVIEKRTVSKTKEVKIPRGKEVHKNLEKRVLRAVLKEVMKRK